MRNVTAPVLLLSSLIALPAVGQNRNNRPIPPPVATRGRLHPSVSAGQSHRTDLAIRMTSGQCVDAWASERYAQSSLASWGTGQKECIHELTVPRFVGNLQVSYQVHFENSCAGTIDGQPIPDSRCVASYSAEFSFVNGRSIRTASGSVPNTGEVTPPWELVQGTTDEYSLSESFLRIPTPADQRSELMSITIPK